MIKLDLHIHSCYSKSLFGHSPPSKSTPEDIIKTAVQKEISVISITDHDNIIGSLKAIKIAEEKYKGKIIVIPGVEVTSLDGHILAYNVYEDIPEGLSAVDTINIIQKAGGFAVAAHPFNIKFSIKKRTMARLKDKLFAIEISNSRSFKNKYTKQYVNKHDLAYTVGSDAHSLREIGLCYGETDEIINSIEDMLRVIRDKKITHVHTYNKKISRRAIFCSTSAFIFWKIQKIKSVFDKSVFLPHQR